MVPNLAKGQRERMAVGFAPDPAAWRVSSSRSALDLPSPTTPNCCHETEPTTTTISNLDDSGCRAWCSASSDGDTVSNLFESEAPTLKLHEPRCKPPRKRVEFTLKRPFGEQQHVPVWNLAEQTAEIARPLSLSQAALSSSECIQFAQSCTALNATTTRQSIIGLSLVIPTKFEYPSLLSGSAGGCSDGKSLSAIEQVKKTSHWHRLLIYWLLFISITCSCQVRLASCRSISDQQANGLQGESSEAQTPPDNHLNFANPTTSTASSITTTSAAAATSPPLADTQPTHPPVILATTPQPVDQSKRTTLSSFFETISSAFTSLLPVSTRTTPIPPTTPLPTEETTPPSVENDTGSRDDDYDAESGEGLSVNGSTEAKNLTDTERLVNLQTYIQRKIKQRLLSATRTGMEVFEKLSLSGGCISSLMTMASSLGQIKSFAFKFIDASAKIPSGVMYGLLSDYGDFDQCLSIRSDPKVKPEDEVEENSFSGKYCLLSVKLNYHIDLPPNASVPEGIIADGILWDELVRNYWTSKSSKGFQVGICVPSRCNTDDLDQIYKYVTESYNVQGEVMTCQDSNDLKRQLTPDTVQLIIIYGFVCLVILTVVGSLVDRYIANHHRDPFKVDQPPKRLLVNENDDLNQVHFGRKLTECLFFSTKNEPKFEMIYRILVCFSIRRNWKIFISHQNAGQDLLVTSRHWKDPHRSVLPERSQLQDGSSRCSGAGYAGPMTELTNQSTSSMSFSCSNSSIGNSSEPHRNIIRNISQTGIGVSTTNFCSSEQTLVPKEIEDKPEVAQRRPMGQQFSEPLTVDVRLPNVPGMFKNVREANYSSINHLSGLKLIVIVWITIGHSFLYPSANNYQYYRSIINIQITRDSVWFATTNFTLGIDMLLYMAGLVFVYKLARTNNRGSSQSDGNNSNDNGSSRLSTGSSLDLGGLGILRSISRKVLRFWPTYLAVIALAIVVPLVADGPMWPEMVSRRLGSTCRKNYWANLLVVNNFFSEPEICLPSSWFVSVLMQLILVGSIIITLARRFSLAVAVSVLVVLLLGSSALSFSFAYFMNIRAPVIRMDESFVMELDENIFKLYTNIFNNLGPFLIGIAGGLILLKSDEAELAKRIDLLSSSRAVTVKRAPRCSPNCTRHSHLKPFVKTLLKELAVAILVALIAIAVLSSVFHTNYSRLESSIYWGTHRIGWAIVTGYLIHQCATGKWRLLYDMLSLSTFIPLSKLVVISYLVYPIFIYLHSGFVRDGLHVSIYNMMNIYITRLVLTFITSLIIHLLVELPFCSLEEILLPKWIRKKVKTLESEGRSTTCNPLLAVAPVIELDQGDKSSSRKHTQAIDTDNSIDAQ